MPTDSRSRRLFRNTALLYAQMFFVLCVTLYSSRLVLAALGFDDYGLYNVVGGMVMLFAILTSALTSAVDRFLTFEIGKGSSAERISRVFSTTVFVMLGLAVAIAVLVEGSGLWYIAHKINVSPDRIPAARFVLHCTVLTFVADILSVPYFSLITAHEKISAFAYFNSLSALLKAAMAYSLPYWPFDTLYVHAVSLMLIAVLIRVLSHVFCRRHFPAIRFHARADRRLFSEIFKFSGWNFFGVGSVAFVAHGGNLLLNFFFGPVVNAARAVSNSVNNAIYGLVGNLMTAAEPQITKSYAAGDRDYLLSVTTRISRVAYFIMFTGTLPFLFEADYAITLWLGNVPPHSALFSRLVLVGSLAESLSRSLNVAALATGRIRNYQLLSGFITLSALPLAYLFLRMGYPPESVLWASIFMSAICLVCRLLLLRPLVGLSFRTFMREVLLRLIPVTLLAPILPWMVFRALPYGATRFLAVGILSVVSALGWIYLLGIKSSERTALHEMLRTTLRRLRGGAGNPE